MKYLKNWLAIAKVKNKEDHNEIHKFNTVIDLAKKIRGLSYDGGYKYLVDIMENSISDRKLIVCKGSQLGFSDCLINVTLFSLFNSKPCLYILPTADEIRDFSTSRFDTPIKKMAFNSNCDNVHHKIINQTSLYLRGGHSRSKLKSISVQYLIIDEFEEQLEEMIELARERLSGFSDKHEINFSTPKLYDSGIFKEYNKCDKYLYNVPCCDCKRMQPLSLDENLLKIEDGFTHCAFCKSKWPDEYKKVMNKFGKWIKTSVGNGVKGYHISQLYSPTISAEEIVTKLHSCDTDISKQEFFNSKLGLPYESSTSRLNIELASKRIGLYNCDNLAKYAGIDISSASNHYMVIVSRCDYGLIIDKILRPTWDEIPNIIKDNNIVKCIVDANPERYKSKELRALVGNNIVHLALYPKMRSLCNLTSDRIYIQINRTEAIDNILNYYEKNRIIINNHNNSESITECLTHCCNLVRSYRKTRTGIIEPYYLDVGADHYAHAILYADISSLIANKPIDIVTGSFVV